MRRILDPVFVRLRAAVCHLCTTVRNARRKSRQKHGGGLQRVRIDDLNVAAAAGNDQVLLVDQALEKFAKIDPTGAELIKLRFFAGLPNIQAANILGLPERTAKRSWAYARAWLYEELKRQQ